MMEVLTAINDEKKEKEAGYRIRVGQAGRIAYATLNIAKSPAKDHIQSRMKMNEVGEEKTSGSISRASASTYIFLIECDRV